MSRLVLIHWNYVEAEEYAPLLQRAGHEVEIYPGREDKDPRTTRDHPPDAFVIDLNRVPTQGRDVAGLLRRQKATRPVPIIFVDGAPDKVQRVRLLLPDAIYTDWEHAAQAVEEALRQPPRDPIVPGAMDGYAGAPLAKKLGLQDKVRLALLGAPDNFKQTLGRLPVGCRMAKRNEPAGVVVLFCRSQAELEVNFSAAAERTAPNGRLWVAWPKKASGVSSDLSQSVVRAFGLAAKWVDFKVSSFDETWSGLCFTRRK